MRARSEMRPVAVEEAGSRPSLGVQACHRGGHSEKCRRGKSLTLLGSVFGGLQVKLKRHVCLRFLSSTTRLPLKMPHHAQHTDVLLLVVARHVTCGMPWIARRSADPQREEKLDLDPLLPPPWGEAALPGGSSCWAALGRMRR